MKTAQRMYVAAYRELDEHSEKTDEEDEILQR
jgi:hypothetical protein